MSVSFPNTLKELRNKHKVTQKDVAAGAGMSARTLQELENGRVVPTVKTLVALADYFDVSTDYLLQRVDPGLTEFIGSAEKRPQVYVSINGDQDARTETIKALLELECLPVSLFNYPSMADLHSWRLVKKSICESDYYLLILPLHAEHLDFIEQDYRFAQSAKKPRAVFIQKGPLPERLEHFVNQLPDDQERDYWDSPEDLGNAISRRVTKMKGECPPVGLIPGYVIPKEQLILERKLRGRIDALEKQLRKQKP